MLLQAHLPFVRHPEHDRSIEEEWFFEALAECYLPLWRVLLRLQGDNVPAAIALAWSGSLVAMLRDQWLLERFDQWLAERLELLAHERRRAAHDPPLRRMVEYHDARLRTVRDDFLACQRDLLRAFGQLATGSGSVTLELATGSATHAFAPLWQEPRALWAAQVQLPQAPFRAATGVAPRGIWLPECGYVPGMERELAASGIRWFVVDAHGLAFAEPRPPTGAHAPVWCGDSGVAAFARDPLTAAQIWHADDGFPADPQYLDFHRDIGHVLPLADLHGVIGSEHLRRPTGIRYWRITDRSGTHRELYDPDAAAARVRLHAQAFVRHRAAHLRQLRREWPASAPPVIVAPYDAELFGHWWHEGPAFIDALFRELQSTPRIQPTTPGQYLDTWPEQAVATPAASSWGAGGYSGVWLNPATDWIVTTGRRLADALVALPAHAPTGTGNSQRERNLHRRAVGQAWRELLLAQSSDWPFLIRMGTATDYATARARDHLDAAARLIREIGEATIDDAWLDERVSRWGTLFPDQLGGGSA